MVTGKQKFALWLTPESKAQVEQHFKEDNCKSQSEFIEKAIQFYCGYLDTQNASAYLPRILSDVLEGKLGTFGKRIGRLLFKLTVEQDMTANILAADTDIDLDMLDKLRGRCVQEVKRTNGEISFKDALVYQKGL